MIDSLFIEASTLLGATECISVTSSLMDSSLSRLIKAGTLPSFAEAKLSEQLLQAVDVIYIKSCMHRDTKSNNTLVSKIQTQALMGKFYLVISDQSRLAPHSHVFSMWSTDRSRSIIIQ